MKSVLNDFGSSEGRRAREKRAGGGAKSEGEDFFRFSYIIDDELGDELNEAHHG